ncbi:hypothetical protein AB1Y20_011159 [Prymnesium parvum]|uniref:Cyclic nucleotide-binding domain-containing protein n=1 Tax=Prymnesium parvum TaxID=97485 RepID=A0AB34INE7_PRYPA
MPVEGSSEVVGTRVKPASEHDLDTELKESIAHMAQSLRAFTTEVSARMEQNERALHTFIQLQKLNFSPCQSPTLSKPPQRPIGGFSAPTKLEPAAPPPKPEPPAASSAAEVVECVPATEHGSEKRHSLSQGSRKDSYTRRTAGAAPTWTCETTGLLNISTHETTAPIHTETDEPNEFFIPEEKLALLLNPHAFAPPPMPRGVIHPSHSALRRWDLFLLLPLGYISVSIPLLTCFITRQSLVHGMFDLAIDLFFLLDVIVNFRTAFYTPANTLCTDSKKIQMRYLRSWFTIDLLSSVPVQVIFLSYPSLADDYIMITLVKMLRLSRIWRMKVVADLQYDFVMHPAAIQLVKLLVLYFVVLHAVACFYWYTAVRTRDPFRPDTDCQKFKYDQDRISIWAMCDDMLDAGVDRQYARALYAAVLMMLGGDTYPTTSSHEMFSTAIMLLGVFTTSVIIGSCASLVASMGREAAAKQDHFDRLNSSLSYHHVSPSIRLRVRKFIEYLYSSGHMSSEDVYKYLPHSLQTAVEMEKKKPLIQAVSIFQNVSAPCIVAIVHALQQVFMPPHEYIIIQGQYGYCMYFIRRGVVQITVVKDEMETPVAQLSNGAHFGEGAMVMDHQRRANALTLTHCEMEKLDQLSFEAICERHVELAEILQAKSAERARMAELKAREARDRESMQTAAERSENWKKALHKVQVIGKLRLAIDGAMSGERHSRMTPEHEPASSKRPSLMSRWSRNRDSASSSRGRNPLARSKTDFRFNRDLSGPNEAIAPAPHQLRARNGRRISLPAYMRVAPYQRRFRGCDT